MAYRILIIATDFKKMSQCQRLVNQRHILKINSCFWILTVFIIHTALWKHQLGSLSTSDKEGLPAVMRLMKWGLPRGEHLPTGQKSQLEGALWPLLQWLPPTLSNYLLLIIIVSKYSLPSIEYYKVNEAKIKLLSGESRQLFKIIRYALNIPIVNNLSLLLFLLWRYNFLKRQTLETAKLIFLRSDQNPPVLASILLQQLSHIQTQAPNFLGVYVPTVNAFCNSYHRLPGHAYSKKRESAHISQAYFIKETHLNIPKSTFMGLKNAIDGKKMEGASLLPHTHLPPPHPVALLQLPLRHLRPRKPGGVVHGQSQPGPREISGITP